MNNKDILEKFSKNSPLFSVEFFPPKTEEGSRQILRTANKLKDIDIDYVSITYGAGGSTRERTLEYASLLKEIFGFEVMPHLVAYGHSLEEIDTILKRIQANGFNHIMALRGDKPKDSSEFLASEFSYANELISHIKKRYPNMCLACAGYPEKHPEARSIDEDIQKLKLKVEAGAEFIITQLFYDNNYYFDFVQKCRKAGIDKPIIAGILPAQSLKQLNNFQKLCETNLPKELLLKMQENPDEQEKVGLDWAKEQVESLLANKAEGVHLYILNRAYSALEIAKLIKKFKDNGKCC